MATYIGTNGNDNVSTGYDYLYGADGHDRLAATAAGYDVVEGGRGNDFIFFGSTNSSTYGSLNGGDGNDFIIGYQNGDYLYGGEGNDLIVGGYTSGGYSGSLVPNGSGNSGNDYIEGGNGSDAMYGFDGNDVIYGGDGDDSGTISGIADTNSYSTGTFTVSVKAGLYGGDGADYLDGGRGNDMLDGGTGADTMLGGDGNDTFVVDNAGDLVTEGAGSGSGFDTVYASVNYSLTDNTESLFMFGAAAYGTGNTGDNYITGFAGSQHLNGGLGGIDRLAGGGGHDVFDMQGTHFGYEIITDFGVSGAELDAVSFQYTTLHSFADVLTNSVQIGADTYIGDGLGNEVVLIGVSRAALTADNFGFV